MPRGGVQLGKVATFGFEVRTPRRGRCSSGNLGCFFLPEQVEPPMVDAAQVATPEGYAVPVQKLKEVDGDLAAAAHPVAELRGGELPVRRRAGKLAGNVDDPRQL